MYLKVFQHNMTMFSVFKIEQVLIQKELLLHFDLKEFQWYQLTRIENLEISDITFFSGSQAI